MAKIIADQSVSLDGFSAGLNVRPGNPLGDGGERLHEWYAHGGKQVRDELFGTSGAIVIGRTMFDVGVTPWGEDPPFHMPVFIVTHQARPPLAKKGGTTYFFVPEGISAAAARARQTAKGKNVAVIGGAKTIQQFLNANFIDEIHIHLVHGLLGDGVRFFSGIDAETTVLECIRQSKTRGVTHLTFRIVNRARNKE